MNSLGKVLVLEIVFLACHFLISLFCCFSDGYFVGLEHYCVGSFCLKLTQFQALVDSGTSFTYLPTKVYEKIVFEVLLVFNFIKLKFFPIVA